MRKYDIPIELCVIPDSEEYVEVVNHATSATLDVVPNANAASDRSLRLDVEDNGFDTDDETAYVRVIENNQSRIVPGYASKTVDVSDLSRNRSVWEYRNAPGFYVNYSSPIGKPINDEVNTGSFSGRDSYGTTSPYSFTYYRSKLPNTFNSSHTPPTTLLSESQCIVGTKNKLLKIITYKEDKTDVAVWMYWNEANETWMYQGTIDLERNSPINGDAEGFIARSPHAVYDEHEQCVYLVVSRFSGESKSIEHSVYRLNDGSAVWNKISTIQGTNIDPSGFVNSVLGRSYAECQFIRIESIVGGPASQFEVSMTVAASGDPLSVTYDKTVTPPVIRIVFVHDTATQNTVNDVVDALLSNPDITSRFFVSTSGHDSNQVQVCYAISSYTNSFYSHKPLLDNITARPFLAFNRTRIAVGGGRLYVVSAIRMTVEYILDTGGTPIQELKTIFRMSQHMSNDGGNTWNAFGKPKASTSLTPLAGYASNVNNYLVSSGNLMQDISQYFAAGYQSGSFSDGPTSEPNYNFKFALQYDDVSDEFIIWKRVDYKTTARPHVLRGVRTTHVPGELVILAQWNAEGTHMSGYNYPSENDTFEIQDVQVVHFDQDVSYLILNVISLSSDSKLGNIKYQPIVLPFYIASKEANSFSPERQYGHTHYQNNSVSSSHDYMVVFDWPDPASSIVAFNPGVFASTGYKKYEPICTKFQDQLVIEFETVLGVGIYPTYKVLAISNRWTSYIDNYAYQSTELPQVVASMTLTNWTAHDSGTTFSIVDNKYTFTVSKDAGGTETTCYYSNETNPYTRIVSTNIANVVKAHGILKLSPIVNANNFEIPFLELVTSNYGVHVNITLSSNQLGIKAVCFDSSSTVQIGWYTDDYVYNDSNALLMNNTPFEFFVIVNGNTQNRKNVVYPSSYKFRLFIRKLGTSKWISAISSDLSLNVSGRTPSISFGAGVNPKNDLVMADSTSYTLSFTFLSHSFYYSPLSEKRAKSPYSDYAGKNGIASFIDDEGWDLFKQTEMSSEYNYRKLRSSKIITPFHFSLSGRGMVQREYRYLIQRTLPRNRMISLASDFPSKTMSLSRGAEPNWTLTVSNLSQQGADYLAFINCEIAEFSIEYKYGRNGSIITTSFISNHEYNLTVETAGGYFLTFQEDIRVESVINKDAAFLMINSNKYEIEDVFENALSTKTQINPLPIVGSTVSLYRKNFVVEIPKVNLSGDHADRYYSVNIASMEEATIGSIHFIRSHEVNDYLSVNTESMIDSQTSSIDDGNYQTSQLDLRKLHTLSYQLCNKGLYPDEIVNQLADSPIHVLLKRHYIHSISDNRDNFNNSIVGEWLEPVVAYSTIELHQEGSTEGDFTMNVTSQEI